MIERRPLHSDPLVFLANHLPADGLVWIVVKVTQAARLLVNLLKVTLRTLLHCSQGDTEGVNVVTEKGFGN